MNAVAGLVLALLAVPEVEIKVYLGEAPVLIASVPVNDRVALRGAGGLSVDGEIQQDGLDGEVSYELDFHDEAGNRDGFTIRVPFASCTQKPVELDQRYVVRLCGASADSKGRAG